MLDAPTRARLLARAVHVGGRAEEEFAGREADLERYVARATGRFAVTARLARRAIARGDRVLELGADPFVFTQLLVEQGARPVLAGQPRGVWTREPNGVDPVRLRWEGHDERLALHRFDAERDLWPFADGAFDVVVCMELLEHLSYSPAHLVHEANRVLRDDGALLLTTPNALAAETVSKVLRGRSFGEHYSGYGPCDRHNREYSRAEVDAVLRAGNFAPVVDAHNIAGYEPPDRLARALRALAAAPAERLARHRDHLFALARKVGPPVFAHPAWLYHAIHPERMREGGVALVR
jgi:SAM-dependent methyltransferase